MDRASSWLRGFSGEGGGGRGGEGDDDGRAAKAGEGATAGGPDPSSGDAGAGAVQEERMQQAEEATQQQPDDAVCGCNVESVLLAGCSGVALVGEITSPAADSGTRRSSGGSGGSFKSCRSDGLSEDDEQQQQQQQQERRVDKTKGGKAATATDAIKESALLDTTADEADEEEEDRDDSTDTFRDNEYCVEKGIKVGAAANKDEEAMAGTNKTWWGRICRKKKRAALLLVIILGCSFLALLGWILYAALGPKAKGGGADAAAGGSSTPSLPGSDAGAGMPPIATVTTAAPSPTPTAGTTPATDSAGGPVASTPIGSAVDSSPPAADSAAGHRTFSFYVMGDGPYKVIEWGILEEQLKGLDAGNANDDDGDGDEGALFAVHVGDIMDSGTQTEGGDCTAGQYAPVRDLFVDTSPVPTLMLAGDNDWMDCENRDEAWGFWTQNFVRMEMNWSANNSSSLTSMPIDYKNNDIANMVERDDVRAENFALTHNGVLFVGINVIKRQALSEEQQVEFDAILDEDERWLRHQIDRHSFADAAAAEEEEEDIRAIIMFGHAFSRSFFVRIAGLLRGTGVPVLFIHGNGHTYQVEKNLEFLNYDNFWSVQVDQIGIAPPIKVTVRATTKEAPQEGGAATSAAADDPPLAVGSNGADFVFADFISLDRRGGTENGPLGY